VDEHGCPADADGDGVADGCDQCPGTFAGDAVGANGCSTADEDGDGVLNDVDACRGTPACATASVGANGCPTDSDGDGLLDGCDRCPGSNDRTDTDSDGVPDCLDPCPNAVDSDGDGVQDCQDRCPNDPLKRDPGACGCGNPDADTDGNGIPDCVGSGESDPQYFLALGRNLGGGYACGIGWPGLVSMLSMFMIVGGLRRVRHTRRRT
jgi:hypothetical protein